MALHAAPFESDAHMQADSALLQFGDDLLCAIASFLQTPRDMAQCQLTSRRMCLAGSTCHFKELHLNSGKYSTATLGMHPVQLMKPLRQRRTALCLQATLMHVSSGGCMRKKGTCSSRHSGCATART